MYIEQLREVVPLTSQNTVTVSNKITLLIPYYTISGLVTLLKIIDAPIQVSDIFYLTVVSSSSFFAFRYSLFWS